MNLDLLITLRCNAKCWNCVELCNSEPRTGLNYDDSDMTLGQIDHFIDQVKEKGRVALFDYLTVTGGEALLHPHVEEIVRRLEPLLERGYVRKLCLNSNLILPSPPSLKKYIINFSQPKDNWKIHHAALLHPTDFGGETKTYATCVHYRKNMIVLSYQGYSLCCAGDAYIRLFGMEELIVDTIPMYGPPAGMDRICEHCPFGNEERLPKERNVGLPVSAIYTAEAEKNKAGRRITKRFPKK